LNINAYLERINYPLTDGRSLAPTAETLRRLQVAHLLTVPFENLSIHAGEPIVLDDDALFTKIVRKRRGGFCYEANGLFAALLRALGFEVTMLSAEVANAEGVFGPHFDHMTLMVSPKDVSTQRWLVDVGFGDSFLEPLLLDEGSMNQDQVQGNRSYRIVPDGDYLVLMQRDESDSWKAQYRFTLESHTYVDFAEMCQYHQTSPDSHFTRSRICSRATQEGQIAGRITLSESPLKDDGSKREIRLITTYNSGSHQSRQERLLTSDEDYATVLRDQFGIVMG
jgi:N-hydroxyarylamine O-acetyltransferase